MPCHQYVFLEKKFLYKSLGCVDYALFFMAACMVVIPSWVYAAQPRPLFLMNADKGATTVPVLSVTQEVITHTEKTNVCWQTIVTDREMAQRQYASQPWLVKHWQPILGGILGGLTGYHFTRNYGQTSAKWIYPTVAAGIGVGVLAGPGMVAGAYLGGSIAQHFWPEKLPLTIVLSMVGGILGDGLMKLLFPDSPPQELLQPTQPGVYLSDQQFYLETTCMPTTRVLYTEKPFRVTYRYQGEERSAVFKYYPGNHIELNDSGWPIDEMAP